MAGDSPAPEEAIRECPFCGGRDVVLLSEALRCGLAALVECQGCEASMGADTDSAAIAAWNRRAGGEREQRLADWIRENSYVLAMAAVGAYEMAPNGSGIDHSLGSAGDAIVAMIEGERDPLEAVRKVIPAGRLWKEDTHWLPRWQSGEAKVVADTAPPSAALARAEGE